MVASAVGALQPLGCPSCAGLVPLGDADAVTCPFCGTRVDIPADHRAARDAARKDAASRSEATALYRALGVPPRAPLRWAARSAGRFALALGILFPVPATLVIYFINRKPVFGVQLYDVLTGEQQVLAGFAAPFILVFLGIVLAAAARRHAIFRGRLQSALAARPPERPGGAASCRHCGGPLDVGPRDLGVRCLYCGADNLVRMPASWVAAMRSQQARVAAAIESIAADVAAERRRYRRSLIARVVGGGLALGAPIALVAGMMSGADTTIYGPHETPAWGPAIAGSLRTGCAPHVFDLAPIILTDDDCVPEGCVARTLLPLRRGDRVTIATGAPPERRRAQPLPASATVVFERHVVGWLSGGDPTRTEWGETLAKLEVVEGKPVDIVADASGWFRVTTVLPGARAGEWYSLCALATE